MDLISGPIESLKANILWKALTKEFFLGKGFKRFRS